MSAGAAVLAAAVLAGCGDAGADGGTSREAAEAGAARSARFGPLEDLVLFPRPAHSGGPFWMDRFETTRADWEAWLTATGQPVTSWLRHQRWNPGSDGSLPVVGITLTEARAHARWRCLRLPRLDEWRHAATAGSRYRLPWGDAERDSWANTVELGLGQLVPVGTFESGRQPGGPYDLIGNAAEWTETPAPGWLFADARIAWREAFDLSYRMAVAGRHPALSVWAVTAEPRALLPILMVRASDVPRACAAGFARPMIGAGISERGARGAEWRLLLHRAAERGSTLGMRLVTDPVSLLDGLGTLRELPSTADLRHLRSFVRRAEHAVLLREVARSRPWLLPPDAALRPLLAEELDL